MRQLLVLACLVALTACAPAATPTPIVITATNEPPKVVVITNTPKPPTSIPEPTATLLSSDNQPPARGYSRMVYDESTGKAHLFGGYSQPEWNSDLWDVWEYDPGNTRWQLVWKSDKFFLPFNYDSLALDSQSNKVILYTVAWDNSNKATSRETWAFDLTTYEWKKMEPSTQPSARWGSRMAYDTESDRVILFGGTDADTAQTLNDTWAYAYENDTWTELQTKGDMTPHHFADMVYDPVVDRVILFGGLWSPGSDQWTLLNDTWAFDYNSNTWAQLQPKVAPSPRAYHTLAFDYLSKRIALFGGILAMGSEPTTDETWSYSYETNSWLKLAPKDSPGQRAWHQMVGMKDGVLAFGGGTSRNSYTNETWVYSSLSNSWELVK